MKQFILLFFACLLISFSACETDFEVNSPWKETTIIYGLLDPNKSTQYIRINKAYLDDTANALDIAQIADSSYHANITAVLEEYDNYSILNDGKFILENKSKSIPLILTKASEEGIKKADGTFYNSADDYYLYKTNVALDDRAAYKIVVETGKETVTAVTPLTKDYDITLPRADREFRSSPNIVYVRMKLENDDNNYIFDLDIDIKYNEISCDDLSDVTTKKIKYNVFSNLLRSDLKSSGSLQSQYDNLTVDKILEFMVKELPKEDNKFRELVSYNFRIYTATEEFYNYYLVDLTQQSSITVGQFKPEYTNVENGLGLFSSRTEHSVLIDKFTSGFINNLAREPETAAMDFAPTEEDQFYPDCQ